MTQIKSAWLAHQQRRWLRPDAQRWLRPDASRWLRPDQAHDQQLKLYDRKYSPDQPRVPAGSPEGGEWTNDNGSDDGGGGADSEEMVNHHEVVEDNDDFRIEIERDETGQAPWSEVLNRYDGKGTLLEQVVLNRDGSTIKSTYNVGQADADWSERHTVTLAGGEKFVFQNSGSTQTIYDVNGQKISQASLLSGESQGEATVQPVFWSQVPRVAAGVYKTLEAGLALYTWMSTRNGADGTAVATIPADVFVPGETPKAPPLYAGHLTVDQLDVACPAHQKIQSLTNQAASETNRADYDTPQKYGTAVHKRLRDKVDDLGNPNLRGEVSLLKTLQETGDEPPEFRQETIYGSKGSIRIDVLENTRTGVVCVYDIKTGLAGLSRDRIKEIVKTVYMRFPDARRIVIMETRPQG